MIAEFQTCGSLNPMTSPNALFERIATRPKLEPQPFSGWALELACRIDDACPSFLSHTFHASSLKRQAILAALAELNLHDPEDLAFRLRIIAQPNASRR